MPVQRLNDEHRSIRSMMDQLESAVTAGARSDRDGFISLLRQLVAGLEEHFDFEEEGGLFEELASTNASLDRIVKRLFQQHVVLRADFRAVLGMVDADKSIEEIGGPLRKAMGALREHEQQETDFVQEALNRDTGAAD